MKDHIMVIIATNLKCTSETGWGAEENWQGESAWTSRTSL